MYKFSSGSFASAGSAGSGSTASSAGNPQLKAPVYNFDMSSVSGAISQYFANRKMAEETRGLSLQNDLTKSFGSTEAIARIAGLVNGNYNWLSPDYQAILMESAAHLGKNYVSMSDLATQEKLIQNSLLNLQANAQHLQNKYFETSAVADILLKVQNLVKSKTFDAFFDSSGFGKGLSVFDKFKRAIIGGIVGN